MTGLNWPAILNALARRVNPLMGSLLGRMQYDWVTAQCEYSTDVMFKSEAAVKELYPKLISHSALCFGAREIMGFFGRKLAGTFRGEYMSDMTDRSRYRLSGMRIKHRVKVNWIKMYDKAGSVLRDIQGSKARQTSTGTSDAVGGDAQGGGEPVPLPGRVAER
jgi:hypothetical protein